MTIEQVELRKILTQMLADNGINRETIIPFVKDIISEKVDIAVNRIAEETNLSEMAKRTIQQNIDKAVSSEVQGMVRRCFSNISVSINMFDAPEPTAEKSTDKG